MIAQNCIFAVGVVGGNEGSRHVVNGDVGGWHEERRSVQRRVRVLPPPANIVILQRLCGRLALQIQKRQEEI